MATNIKIYFPATNQPTFVVDMFRASEAWTDDAANHVTGVHDGTNYVFTVDIDSAAIWSATVPYKIAKSDDAGLTETDLLDDLMLGDIKTATNLATHIADTSTHGSATALVGVDEAQTLTLKVIDADNNTISNLEGDNFKALTSGKEAPAWKVKPGADNTVLHIDTSSATDIEIQAATAAKGADRILTVIAGSVDLENRAGADIKITGLAAATGTTEAVRFDEFDALDTRVDALEVGATFINAPVVTASVTIGRQIRSIGRITTTRLQLSFQMDVDNFAKVRRWEIFYGEGQQSTSAGTITSDELDYLRDNFNRILIRGDEGSRYDFETIRDQYFTFVAIDDSNNRYASDPIFSSIWGEGQIPPDRDDNNDEIQQYETLSNPSVIATTADDNEAAEFSAADWQQTSTTPKIKTRIMYKHRTGYQTLLITCGLKTSADTGYVKAVLTARGGAALTGKNATGSTVSASYEDVILEIDVSTVAVVGTRYELEISIWNSAAAVSTTMLEDAISLEIAKNIEVY